MAKAKNKKLVKKDKKPVQEPVIEIAVPNKGITFESPAQRFICYVAGKPYKFINHRLYVEACSDKIKETLIAAGCKEV